MTTETITWRGEEWEVDEGSVIEFPPRLAKHETIVKLKRKPKPLREEWQVVDSTGLAVLSLDSRQVAESCTARCAAMNMANGPFTIVHMREVRGE